MRTAAFSCVFLLLSACPPRPVDFGSDGEPRDADDLLLRTRLAELSVTSVKGEAKLKATSQRGSGTAGLFVAVVEPATVHLEALDFFGRPQAQLITDGKRFGLYDAQAGKYFTGPASAANVARVLPVPMPPAELAALLLGRVPRNEANQPPMALDRATGRFHVDLGSQQVEIEPPSYRVVKSTSPAYDVDFSAIEAVGPLTFPKHAELSSSGARMALDWKELELNVPPDASMFEMTPPENVPVVEVDARGLEVRAVP